MHRTNDDKVPTAENRVPKKVTGTYTASFSQFQPVSASPNCLSVAYSYCVSLLTANDKIDWHVDGLVRLIQRNSIHSSTENSIEIKFPVMKRLRNSA